MISIPQHVQRLISILKAGGATDAIIVGGFVRDSILGIQSKDVDVEVYGLNYSQISELLAPHFHVDLVGRAFGVLKVGRDVDVALPRRESKNGSGHKAFNIESTSDITLPEAFARRDFTINAIGMRSDGSYYDPYDGIGDIKRKILRATSESFKDDPLRVMRAVQFAARFGFTLDEQTVQYCREVFSEFSTLSPERIYDEWKKWALKGKRPERGLDVLIQTGWVKGFPELSALVDCPQNPQWHPEGDVWTHTRLVCIEAAKAIEAYEPKLSDEEKTVVMFAALAHDFGKPTTTKYDEEGVLRSKGHAEEGAIFARTFLERMRAPIKIVNMVERLVACHMATNCGATSPTPKAARRLARKLEPANIKLWTLLCQSDALGCGTCQGNNNPSEKMKFQPQQWLQIAEECQVKESGPTPIIQGRDLLQLNVKPGPNMGKLLKNAFEAQLDGVFTDYEGGIEYIAQFL